MKEGSKIITADKIAIRKISAPALSSVTYGKDIDDVFNNINENFEKLVNSDFLRGQQGESLLIEKCDLSDVNWKSVLNAIKEAIYFKYENSSYGALAPLTYIDNNKTYTIQWYDNLINKSSDNRNVINMVRALTEKLDKDGKFEGTYIKENVSSLPFIIKDARFSKLFDIKQDLSDNNKLLERIDVSCVIQFTGMIKNPYRSPISGTNNFLASIDDPDYKAAGNYDTREYVMNFEILDIFPTLYYDTTQQNFCWKVWGDQTGIIANGPKGEEGKSGNFISVIRKYNDTGADGNYDIKNVITETGDIIEVNKEKIHLYNNAMAIVFPDNTNVSDKNGNNGCYWITKLRISDNGNTLIAWCGDENKVQASFNKSNVLDIMSSSDFPGLFVPTEFDESGHGNGGFALYKQSNDHGKSELNINWLAQYAELNTPSGPGSLNTENPVNLYGPVNLICGNNTISLNDTGIILKVGTTELKIASDKVVVKKNGGPEVEIGASE